MKHKTKVRTILILTTALVVSFLTGLSNPSEPKAMTQAEIKYQVAKATEKLENRIYDGDSPIIALEEFKEEVEDIFDGIVIYE